jgi:putative ABC transport system substrate-binding protein
LNVRYNDGVAANARTHAAELVALSPAAILSASTTNLKALQGATRAIPIVFVQVSDPVAQGFVTTVTKPGGNITGFSAYEFSVGGKWLELLKQMSPGLAHIGVMSNPDTSPQTQLFIRAIESAAPSFGIQAAVAPVRTVEEIESVIRSYGNRGGGGFILPTDSFTRLHLKLIADRSIQFRIPTIAAFPEFIDSGGLMFYGSTTSDELATQYRNAASYIDRTSRAPRRATCRSRVRAASGCSSTAGPRRRWGLKSRQGCFSPLRRSSNSSARHSRGGCARNPPRSGQFRAGRRRISKTNSTDRTRS